MTRPQPFSASARLGRRGLLLGAGGLLGGGLLAACGSEEAPPPDPPQGPEPSPTPNTTAEQFGAFISEIHDAVAEADEERDASVLAPRVTGSAADFRTQAYSLIDEVEEWADHLTRPGDELLVPITSTTEEFPRTVIALVSDAVDEDAEDEGIPYFMILQQADARSPYTTWGWAQQELGIEMPTVPDGTVGSDRVDAESDGLLMTPADALELYARVLSDGTDADEDGQLAESGFQTDVHAEIQQEREEINDGVEWDEAATIKEVYTPVEDELGGLRTDDGGAVVLGTITSTRRVSTRNEATVSFTEENIWTETIGSMEFSEEFVREYGTTVALYIPPEGSDAQIQPIGATKVVTGTSGS